MLADVGDDKYDTADCCMIALEYNILVQKLVSSHLIAFSNTRFLTFSVVKSDTLSLRISSSVVTTMCLESLI
jgi:hypothetical protein